RHPAQIEPVGSKRIGQRDVRADGGEANQIGRSEEERREHIGDSDCDREAEQNPHEVDAVSMHGSIRFPERGKGSLSLCALVLSISGKRTISRSPSRTFGSCIALAIDSHIHCAPRTRTNDSHAAGASIVLERSPRCHVTATVGSAPWPKSSISSTA